MEITAYEKAEKLKSEINRTNNTLNILFTFKADMMLDRLDISIKSGSYATIAYINDREISDTIIAHAIELFQNKVKELQKQFDKL